MVMRASVRTSPAVLAALGFILAAAGCQSGNPVAALNIGGQQDAGEERITVEELLAYCPSATIREAQSVHDTFQRGGDGEPSRIVHRSSLTEVTRACTYGNGVLGMTVAVAGKVVPGPVGTTGTVRLPIRVTVYQGGQIIHDRVQDHQVTVADTAGATQFIFNDAGISMPQPSSQNVQVFVGFDTAARR